MKLKKFAAMMLAGVMAVSMLAGCSGKGTNGGNNGGNTVVEPSSSSIVTAFNNGQDEDNDVKVNFTTDSALESVLAKAVDAATEYAPDFMIRLRISSLNGKAYDTAFWTKDDYKSADDLKDGATRTVLSVERYDSNDFWTEADALNKAGRDVDELIADLYAGKREGAVGDKYYTFGYTGNVAMVSVERNSGSTAYYVAYTITQTAKQETVKAEA